MTSANARTATVVRETRETSVSCTINLDGTGAGQRATGVPFLDHMLDQLARHGGLDLDVTCHGDLEIDTHHSVEDCALVIGRAFNEALGDRAGISRMGFASVPMDEALAVAAIDLSGRPYAVISTGDAGGAGLAPSLLAHFVESFAAEARLCIHLSVVAGRDAHHMAEAAFKALARAVSMAVAIDPRRQSTVGSTKGTLVG
jgi:imidazoleglycerol-phosphate dehydratase